jgi:hypothetical protein
MKEEKYEVIQTVFMPILQKSKDLREQFLAGKSPSIGAFLMRELVDLTFEFFHGMNQIEYQTKIQVLIEQIAGCQKEEINF